MSHREKALALFRSCLRAARTWKGDAEEAQYIRDEARQQFRSHRGDASEAAAAALEEGERRLQVALHYGIAFPRMFHADQFAKVPYVQAPRLEGAEEPEAIVSGVKDAGTAAKLAAAARRRKERRAQQQQQQQPGAAGD